MSVPIEVVTCDPIWSALCEQAEALVREEPALASSVHATVLAHHRLEDALSYHLAKKIGGADVSSMLARDIFEAAMAEAPEIGEAVRADLSAVFERDPACEKHLGLPVLQGLPGTPIAPRGAPVVEARPHVAGALPTESRLGAVRARHPSGGAAWPWHHDGPRDRDRDRRDRGGRG